jgi:hypothetical protein
MINNEYNHNHLLLRKWLFIATMLTLLAGIILIGFILSGHGQQQQEEEEENATTPEPIPEPPEPIPIPEDDADEG